MKNFAFSLPCCLQVKCVHASENGADQRDKDAIIVRKKIGSARLIVHTAYFIGAGLVFLVGVPILSGARTTFSVGLSTDELREIIRKGISTATRQLDTLGDGSIICPLTIWAYFALGPDIILFQSVFHKILAKMAIKSLGDPNLVRAW